MLRPYGYICLQMHPNVNCQLSTVNCYQASCKNAIATIRQLHQTYFFVSKNTKVYKKFLY
ncbi:hypothetical protein [Microcoleus sp. CAWBG58]|uniref:hypothetical protein n=1 Tax=Microcoleus sp. CAWBG58 TaxID=2841651 RepID=UPI0025D08F2D|nr:hypothetical protein [Microcoleus sp. CAWBG58]